jgi:HD-GYP domain-containing protein (c-di-GMP phosphodiesterase class II)
MTGPRISVAEIMGALSLAVDLGLGQPLEQGVRTCLVATKFAESMGLDDEDRSAVYDASLLRFVGCNAERQLMASYFGDEVRFATHIGPVAQGGMGESLRAVVSAAGSGRPAPARVLAIGAVLANFKKFEEVSRAHCEVAALLAERLGFGSRMVDSLQHGFDRWDGKEGIAKGEDIPLEIRIAAVAHDAEIFHRLNGVSGAVEVVTRRAGKALDPTIARAFAGVAGDILAALDADSVWADVMAADGREGKPLAEDDIDDALRACSDFADMTTAYLAGHSAAVARLAADAAALCGLSPEEARRVGRAGYVHELGRTGVSVSVWNKEGSLTEAEWENARLYPYYTERTTSRSPFLAEVGAIAAHCQERLDGSGYHKGVPASMLPVGSRLLAAADVFNALDSERPYRPANSKAEAAAILRDEARAGRLDGRAVEAVLEVEGQRGRRRTREWPRGLTTREVEVLRLIAGGKTTKEIAGALVISHKTVDNHIQHIYEKLNVTTRSGAAFFAIQHDLIEIVPAQR